MNELILYLPVNFNFWIMKTLWNLAHENVVNIIDGHCVGINIHGCQPYPVIAIYVLTSADSGLFCSTHNCNLIFRLCCYRYTTIWCHYITWISSTLSKRNRLYMEYSSANWTIDSIQFSTFWCRKRMRVSYSASDILSNLIHD